MGNSEESLKADLVLENGDQIFFPSRLTGKHYRAFQATIATSYRTKQVMNPSNGKMETKADIDNAEYAEQVIQALPSFVDRIISKDGTDIKPTVEYYDDLDFTDAQALYARLQNLLIEAQVGKKKKKS